MGYTVYINHDTNKYSDEPLCNFNNNRYISLWNIACEDDMCLYTGKKYYIKSIITKLKSLIYDMTKESIIMTLHDLNNTYTDNPDSHVVLLYSTLLQYDENSYITFI
jgi:hypothetical protein